ncbi:MAG: glycosyltransferase family 4 protein [Anaerolineales bacterium]|nr:glycosyltransferase family 4 protein [Anaerolineales bacterium]
MTENSRIRVAFVIPLLRGRGGWPTAALGILRSLESRVEPILVVARADGEAARSLFPRAEIAALPEIQPNVAGSLRTWAHMLPTLAALRTLPPLRVRLVHSLELFPTGWIGDRIARRECVPHAVTTFGTYGVVWRRWAIPRRICDGIIRRAACLCPMSTGTAERMRAAFPGAMAAAKVRVVLHGSDFAARIPRETAERKKFSPDPTVISVGGIKPRKGYHVCLQAFGILQRRFPGARFLLAGGGVGNRYQRELEALIRREGIRNVEFLGPLTWEQLDPHYRAADMLAMTSQDEGDHFEGFVFVFLEAGAYGLPVVGTRSGGIPDAVVDGETGYLLPADDVEGVARAMIALAENPELSRKMGLAGRARAETLTWERYAAEQFEIYRSMQGSA